MKGNLAIIGMQWGDEGKGKIVDLLAHSFDIVARFQGGNNAGHTLKVGSKTIVLHSIPSGIFHPQVVNVIGNGVALNPEALIEEMDLLSRLGVDFNGRLLISERAHLIMPYHLYRDKNSEISLGHRKIGTTSKGIGPTYGDKLLRRGIRASCLTSKTFPIDLEEIIKSNLLRIELLYNSKPMNVKDVLKKFVCWREKLTPFITDTSLFLYEAIRSGKRVLFEGAQGTMLDIDHGTYPYVTSSNSSAGGVAAGLGIGPAMVGETIGISKAYCTRVGEGPFPTELPDKEGEMLREVGGEYGATTGRPRRCGWFDALVAKYAVRINCLNYVAITKLDVLDRFDTIQVCTSYKYKDQIITNFPTDLDILNTLEPVYIEFKGWKVPTVGITNYNKLPKEAQYYLSKLEEIMDCPIALISTGPERDESIILNSSFKKKYLRCK